MPTQEPNPATANPPTAHEALLRLSREAVDTALAGNIRRGLALAQDARNRARDAGDRPAELAALNAAARCHSLRNDSINALAAGIDAASLAQSLGDGLALGHALCAITNTAFILKLLEESEYFVTHAIRESVRHGDADLECRTRQSYAVLLGDLDRFTEARAEFALARDAAIRDGRPAVRLRVEGNLINLSRKQARFHAARGEREVLHQVGIDALREAKNLLESARDEQVLALELTMTGLMGEVLVLMGNLEAGRAELARAMDLAIRGRQPSALPPLVLMLAQALRAEGRWAEAKEALLRGLDVAETLRPSFRIAELCDAMAEVEAALGQEADAATWRQRADQERQQFESSRQLAGAFLKRLQAELATAG